ncbi:MAG: 23S rRNA (adenine(2503)-C(2))-methyltransferase RlmN, partial [Trichococcus flocculiformis]
MNTPSIYGLTLDQLEAWLLEQGQKKFRAQQIWDWLYIKRVLDFSEMTNLSKDLVALL